MRLGKNRVGVGQGRHGSDAARVIRGEAKRGEDNLELQRTREVDNFTGTRSHFPLIHLSNQHLRTRDRGMLECCGRQQQLVRD